MNPSRKIATFLAVTALTASGMAALPVAAQTPLTGHHDGSTTGDGYDASAGAYLVPADTGGSLDSTFNGNHRYGLLAPGGSTFTIDGGQFSGNRGTGFENYKGCTVTVTNGQFNNNYDGVGVWHSQVTVSGANLMATVS